MKSYFYDIESLRNVFTLANFRSDADEIDIYYLVDGMKALPSNITDAQLLADATDRIHKKNKNFKGGVKLYPLTSQISCDRLARTFGLSDAYYATDKSKKSSYPADFRLKCSTDEDYDKDNDPYLFGYNSYHYDSTMLSMFLYEIYGNDGKYRPTTASKMRQYNDELFSPRFKEAMEERLRFTYKNSLAPSQGFGAMDYKAPRAIIRKNMLLTGRHLDVARLNEKASKIALKRILGMLGYQILESDKLRPGQDEIENYDQLLDLIAYNVSDVVNLAKLMNHKTYKSAFNIKEQMLKDYPELIYQKKDDKYEPDIAPNKVRNDRLTIDSSSAQFSTKALCPYGHLKDYDTVSFMYPSEAKSKALGIPRVNVLEEARKFFYDKFPQQELRNKFDEIYNYYKSIEGKNFNSSDNYLEDHDIDPKMGTVDDLPAELKPYNLDQIPMPNTFMFYYKADGTPSTCFVNFSSGGIHGAEFNQKLYEHDLKEYEKDLAEHQAKTDLLEKAKALSPDPRQIKINKGIEIDGKKYKPSDFLKPKATKDHAEFKDPPKPPKKPEPFELSTQSNKWGLNSRYTYTSSALAQHEDFTSYYPNMLRMMDAFFNEGLGYDRYGEIFDNKTKYGKWMKDPQYSAEQQGIYSTMRNGTKLVLNSASGAGDANFESNIRMNNKIISMRIIGQLFTWRIGQAQTFEGASIISTNTDGLYSTALEATKNNEILEREAESIHVEIEPEPLYLISKDSNNRAEFEIQTNDDGTEDIGEVISASGGTLSHRKGPNIEKSLAHPAIIDWALTEYLACAAVNYKGSSLDKPFVDELGMSIISHARERFNDDVKTLTMFQNIVASSPSSNRYVFASTDDAPDVPIPLQHYNRTFIVHDKTPGSYHVRIAAAKVITDATIAKRKRDGEKAQQNDPVAASILSVNGIDPTTLVGKEAAVAKLTGIEDSWYVFINNNDIHEFTQTEIDEVFNSLDYEKYLTIMKESFNKNWMNVTPEYLEELERQKNKDNEVLDTLFESPQTGATQVGDITVKLDLSDIANLIPKTIDIQKTTLSNTDIKNGEFILEQNGVVTAKSHTVLAEIFSVMTKTDIDALNDNTQSDNDSETTDNSDSNEESVTE